MDDSQDLTDYLSQLLGRNDEQVQTFVEDVGRFQRGEPVSVEGDVEGDGKPAAVERIYDAKPKAPARTESAKNVSKSKLVTVRRIETAPAKMATAVAPAAAASDSTKQVVVELSKPEASPQPPTTSKPKLEKALPENHPLKSHPPKGKASVVCGCFGSMHKPLTNCLYCGRISCELEGYDYCPFCGILVEQAKGNGEGSKAWEHKERLLRFDRDFARRTVVLDDQADFFTTNWLTEEEKRAAEEKQAHQKEKLRTREKQTLDIAF
jgi:hypothetical protein